MTDNKTIFQLLRMLWQHLSVRRRWQFLMLLILMLIASFAEILSIGAVLPFLQVLTFPEKVFAHHLLQPFVREFHVAAPAELLLPITLAFIIAVTIAGFMRLLLLWASTRLTFAAGSDLSIGIYRRSLYQPYSVHLSRNTSEVISGISNKVSTVIGMINNVLTIVSSFVISTLILVALFLINPVIAISAFCGFGLLYLSIAKVNSKKMVIDSERIAYGTTNIIKIVQEGLGGIRDILIDGTQELYCQIYRNADLTLRGAQARNVFISASPRYWMEVLGITLIALLAYSMMGKTDGLRGAIPTLGALALGSQRLLPIFQQAYGAWSNVKGYQTSLLDTIKLLDQPLPHLVEGGGPQRVDFERRLELKQVCFSYPSQESLTLKNINLTIKKGSRVGFIGSSGSGKSTLLDIVMGLLTPSSGSLELDGQVIDSSNMRAWQRHIAHVPQNIFLMDGSIEENIAFGIPQEEIDHDLVKLSAKQAQLDELIEELPEKYKTIVGERGARLSGGQRQRIGIARALYKQADVVIFDEATSALDSLTEEAVMASIESLSKDLTILIVAHRLSTLRKCTQIVEIEGGHAKRVGSFQQIVGECV